MTLEKFVLGTSMHRHEELNTNERSFSFFFFERSFSLSLLLTLSYQLMFCSAINSQGQLRTLLLQPLHSWPRTVRVEEPGCATRKFIVELYSASAQSAELG